MTAVRWALPTEEVTPALTFTMPRVFWSRQMQWAPYFERVDNTASHPETWDFLAELVRDPSVKTVVEAGTYRGHGLFAMAESLKLRGREGHIWSADVTDFGVTQVLDAMGLSDRVSWCHGRFEDMLAYVPTEIDVAFIDCSEDGNPGLRLDYLDLVMPRLSKHGLVVIDDCSDSPENLWPEAKELRVRCDLYLPRGHGLTIFQKRSV